MKYLKHSLLLFVPVGAVLAVMSLLLWIGDSAVNTPAFAGYNEYLKMFFEHDIFSMVLRNLFPYFMVAMVTATVMYILYGFLRDKLHKVNNLIVYSVVWLVTAISTLSAAFWNIKAYGLLGDSYSADSIVATPSSDSMSLFSVLMCCLPVSVATFVVYTVCKLVIKYKVRHSNGKSRINNDILLTAGVTLMGVYAVLHYVNDVLRTFLLLNGDTTGVTLAKTNVIIKSNFLAVAAVTVGAVLLFKLKTRKKDFKVLSLSLLVLSSLVLFRALAFNLDMLPYSYTYGASGAGVRFVSVLSILEVVGGSYLDIVASVILIIVSARLFSGENDEIHAPSHTVTKTVSRVMGWVGGAVLTVIICCSLLVLIDTQNIGGGSVGIIGGADAPTMWFIFKHIIFDSYTIPVIICAVLILCAVILRIISNKQKSRG